MKAIIGVNIKVEVQKTLGTPVAIQSMAEDSSGVTTIDATAHGFSNGDVVVFNMIEGADQLDRQACRVANKTTDTFEAENVSISGFEAFVSGTVTKITAFASLQASQDVSAPNSAPTKIPTTTLADRTEQFEYGLQTAPDGTITCLYNPGGVTEKLIDDATNDHTDMVIRLTYADGRQAVSNTLVSGGAGFTGGVNAAWTSTVAFTPVKYIKNYVAL